MTADCTYGIASESDFPAVARLISEAFGGPLPGAEEWARSHGASNIRVMREQAEARSCLIRIPMGQFFGGRSVPMVGIAGVGADVTRRGQGLGRRMMTECVREIAAEGVALSALYASTRPLYRQVGFESAGARFEYEIPLDRLPKFTDTLEVRRISPDNQSDMTRCYNAVASTHNGPLDRGAYCWGRVWKFRDEPFKGFGAFNARGEIEGYVTLAQRRPPPPAMTNHDVVLSDAIFTTAAAARTLVNFLAGFTTVGDRLRFFGSPNHAIFMLLGHHHAQIRQQEAWMLRITDVKRALEQRGYNPHVRARLAFEVSDVIDANRGPWTLDVEAGRATATRAASDAPLRTSIRGLAAMYTGYLSPREAMIAGLCEGPAQMLDAAGAVFAGEMPWMVDFF